jgi:hypothetical protein
MPTQREINALDALANYTPALVTEDGHVRLGSLLGAASTVPIVESLAARNALPPVAGQFAFAAHNFTLYQMRPDLSGWDVVLRYGRPEYLTGVQTLYVATTGDDEAGDGLTLATAFRQPQRALTDLEASSLRRGPISGVKLVQCGAGTFQAPIPVEIRGTDYVFVVGDRSTPAITLASAPSFSLVSGRKATWEATVPAFATTITDASHWLENPLDIGIGILPVAETLIASASPQLKQVSNGPFGAGATVHPYTTLFDLPYGTQVGLVDPTPVQLYFSGIKFVNGTFASLRNCVAQGCRYEGTVRLDDATIAAGYVSLTVQLATSGLNASIVSGLVGRSVVVIAGAKAVAQGVVTRATTGNGQLIVDGDVEYSLMDFEGNRPCVYATSPGALARQTGDCVVVGTVASALSLSGGARWAGNAAGGSKLTGTTTGIAAVVGLGCVATSLKLAANGFLTSGLGASSEVQVGGLASQTFASLPATDTTGFAHAS